MSFSKLINFVFGIIFVVILYFIITYALKIMYKDVKGSKKGKRRQIRQAHGLEVIKSSSNENLKQGSIIPVRETISFGRKEDNSIVLNDEFISGYHAKLYTRNNVFFIEDVGSTNGTFVNGSKIEGRTKLNINDEIRLGNIVLKVID
ncbi:FHA domain-containing protein [Inconstantimicrobium mannanitabidum]|uniref:FHA domain-containing protein n=1 Tax=Inconstantimicrobium mannanitabidum TaxID=1604901 RepID=A0ACB5RG17_9CLOT|nr:FHA domain-containing protein [Clostridium sp. TW13]GKX68040.1 FHA domain-containing protein [Clostridium sp. TW13]